MVLDAAVCLQFTSPFASSTAEPSAAAGGEAGMINQTDRPDMRCLSCCTGSSTCQDVGMLHSPGRNISTITDGIDNMAGDGYTAMNQCPDLLRDARPASWAEGKGRGGGGVVLPQSKWPGARRCRPWRCPDARLSLYFFSLSSLCLSDFVITFVICTLRADIPS